MDKTLNPAEEALTAIRGCAPSLDISELEKLVREGHQNATMYIVDSVFAKGIFYSSGFPAVQKEFYGLALHYFKNCKIENESDDPVLDAIVQVSSVFNLLLKYHRLPRKEDNQFYEEIAKEILEFWNSLKEDKDGIKKLKQATQELYGIYFCLGEPRAEWEHRKEDTSILAGIIEEKGEDYLKNPDVVRTVWEKVKEKYKK